MPLRISTITGICNFTESINLNNLYKNINICDKVIFAELGEDYKGVIDKKNLRKREKGVKKFFYNQITFHINIKLEDIDKKVNVKIFNNGSIQMTGLKTEKFGIVTTNYLLEKIKSLKGFNIYDDTKLLDLGKYYIAMINTDFDIGFKINRDNLNTYLNNMGIYTSFEPCTYPGVNIKYYYKLDNKSGICNCVNK